MWTVKVVERRDKVETVVERHEFHSRAACALTLRKFPKNTVVRDDYHREYIVLK